MRTDNRWRNVSVSASSSYSCRSAATVRSCEAAWTNATGAERSSASAAARVPGIRKSGWKSTASPAGSSSEKRWT